MISKNSCICTIVIGLLSLQQGCMTAYPQTYTNEDNNRRTTEITDLLCAMSPTVDRQEANKLAATAVNKTMLLAHEYNVVTTAGTHNLLINLGLKERGLCFQWADDLYEKLQPLAPKTLQVQKVGTDVGDFDEHHALVVTVPGQPIGTGILLDPWRGQGHLMYMPLAKDKGNDWVVENIEGKRQPK